MRAMKPLFLGLDVGTQGAKALVLDVERGRVVARSAVGYGLIEGLAPGAAEQHPSTWVEALRGAARAALAVAGAERKRSPAETASLVGGVGVSGQQHGLVALDAERRVVRPAKLWCDTQTAPEAAALSATLGRRVPTGFTASKVAWLARHEPEAWRRVRHVLLPHDFVNERLTGQCLTEAGDASGTGWFDASTRDWDRDAAQAIDPRLPDLLPRLVADGDPAGELTAAGAGLLGLPAGTPVAAGSGDNMCAAIGSGATHPGVAVVSLGTSGTVFCQARGPVVDPEGLIAGFCDATGGWLPLLCVMNCTNVTEEVRALVAAAGAPHGWASRGRGAGEAADELAALTAAAEQVPTGCEGLLWLPFLQGERVPDLPHASGTLLGLRPGLLRPGHLFRAALAAAWTARRLAGERVEADAVAAPLVAIEPEAILPDPARAAWAAARLARFREAVARVHGEEAAR